MKTILKKILGVLFILVGGLLSLSLLMQIPSLFKRLADNGGANEFGIGYVVGSIMGVLIICALIFFLFKFGFKWLSNKKNPKIEAVSSIGKN